MVLFQPLTVFKSSVYFEVRIIKLIVLCAIGKLMFSSGSCQIQLQPVTVTLRHAAYCTLRACVSKMERILASNEDYQQCKINGLKINVVFCPPIISCSFSFFLDSQHASSPRLSPHLRIVCHLVRHLVFASSVFASAFFALAIFTSPVFASPIFASPIFASSVVLWCPLIFVV